MSKKCISTTSHNFKSNFSKYLRLASEGEGANIIIYRYNKPIGFFSAMPETTEPLNVTIDQKTPDVNASFSAIKDILDIPF